MLVINNATYYSVGEILIREDNYMTEYQITEFLRNNPSYGLVKDGELYSYHTAIRQMNSKDENTKRIYLAGVQGLDMRGVELKGRVLDIGAGGEGIIGQISSSNTIGIAPEEHRKGLERAPGNGIKLLMDARDMKFLDNSFDTAAVFYTLMYIDNNDHGKVMSEIYRVLKPGGECFIWDMVIPEQFNERECYMLGMEIKLKHDVVLTGYGALWKDKVQNTKYFAEIGRTAGFDIIEELEDNHLIYLRMKK